MMKKKKLSKYSMKSDIYRQAVIEELAMTYSVQVATDSLPAAGFAFSGDVSYALNQRALNKLVKILRYGSRRAKVYCQRNMNRLDTRAALHMCKKRLHVGDLDDITIGFLKMHHGIPTVDEALQAQTKVLTTFPHYTTKKESE